MNQTMCLGLLMTLLGCIDVPRQSAAPQVPAALPSQPASGAALKPNPTGFIDVETHWRLEVVDGKKTVWEAEGDARGARQALAPIWGKPQTPVSTVPKKPRKAKKPKKAWKVTGDWTIDTSSGGGKVVRWTGNFGPDKK